uniref:Putative ovule protein n=1 Tax=Solanum chacoense TaxID=4108 RepID=A0A0V0GNE5_SOLCH
MKVRDEQKNMKTTYKYMFKQRQCLSYPQIVTQFRHDRELSFIASGYMKFHFKNIYLSRENE